MNTGGKVIYVDTIGLKTKDGTIIDFDEDVKDEEPLPQPEKPKRGLYGFPIFKMPVFESFKLPKIRSNNFYTINPGDRRRDSKEVNDVIKILNHKKYHYQDTMEFQGIFIDRLGCEHVSDWKQFTLKELLTR